MNKKVDIVVTTIFEPAWLKGYLENIKSHGRQDDVTIRIICDNITPPSVYEAARQAGSQGFKIDCPSLEEQGDFLKKLGLNEQFIPWNTDNRRNIGFLKAWESGADVLISIDDDNYCREDSDFIGSHQIVGDSYEPAVTDQLASGGQWFNICSRLQSQVNDPIYARGFPYAARSERAKDCKLIEASSVAGRTIAVNAGLWIDDPDVDAITRLAQRPVVHSADASGILLSDDTWSPINTQNTALCRQAIPAYYYVRMGFPLQGMNIDRYGDILSGYFIQKCAKHLGDMVKVGSPVAEHHRSPHNLLKDLSQELAGIAIVEDLLPWLIEIEIEGDTYSSAYASLADALLENSAGFKGFVWDEGGREFLVETAKLMNKWLSVIKMIGNEN